MNDITSRILYALGSRGLPNPISGDNTNINIRGTRYGELVTSSILGGKLYALADEGSYFVAVNTTPGTGIIGAAAPTAFDDTKPLVFLRNDASNDKRVYLDFILLMVTAAGTNGTSWNVVMRGDKGTSRYTSGGSTITPANPNMASARTPGLDKLAFGAITAAAATSQARTLHQAPVRTVIKVVGDKYLFNMGDSSVAGIAGIPLEGTTQTNENIPCPPVILDPGDSFLFHEWAPSQSVAAAYEFVMGFWVR